MRFYAAKCIVFHGSIVGILHLLWFQVIKPLVVVVILFFGGSMWHAFIVGFPIFIFGSKKTTIFVCIDLSDIWFQFNWNV